MNSSWVGGGIASPDQLPKNQKGRGRVGQGGMKVTRATVRLKPDGLIQVWWGAGSLTRRELSSWAIKGQGGGGGPSGRGGGGGLGPTARGQPLITA